MRIGLFGKTKNFAQQSLLFCETSDQVRGTCSVEFKPWDLLVRDRCGDDIGGVDVGGGREGGVDCGG